MASAMAVWHQVKEEVMEIHSKLERRTQLDKQVCLHRQSICAVHIGHQIALRVARPPNAGREAQHCLPQCQQLHDSCRSCLLHRLLGSLQGENVQSRLPAHGLCKDCTTSVSCATWRSMLHEGLHLGCPLSPSQKEWICR